MPQDVHHGISIHALHEESDRVQQHRVRYRLISIHALHEESDAWLADRAFQFDISIHALHEESDKNSSIFHHMLPFQSTLSMRRATHAGRRASVSPAISIHALHEESDK